MTKAKGFIKRSPLIEGLKWAFLGMVFASAIALYIFPSQFEPASVAGVLVGFAVGFIVTGKKNKQIQTATSEIISDGKRIDMNGLDPVKGAKSDGSENLLGESHTGSTTIVSVQVLWMVEDDVGDCISFEDMDKEYNLGVPSDLIDGFEDKPHDLLIHILKDQNFSSSIYSDFRPRFEQHSYAKVQLASVEYNGKRFDHYENDEFDWPNYYYRLLPGSAKLEGYY